MKVEQKDIVSDVVCDVLEKMAFMFGEPAQENEARDIDGDAGILVAMKFTGDQEGSLALAAPDGLCLELAAHMLGLEVEDPEAMDKAKDAFKELLNVACGNILTTLAGAEPVFDLSVPEITTINAQDWKALLHEECAIVLIVDDFPVILLPQFAWV